MSCKRAQEFLEQKNIVMDEIIDARKERIDADRALALLKQATQVVVAKGKKVVSFDPATDDTAVLLKQAMGPSGNLRAPALRVGERYLIGFNPEMYQDNF